MKDSVGKSMSSSVSSKPHRQQVVCQSSEWMRPNCLLALNTTSPVWIIWIVFAAVKRRCAHQLHRSVSRWNDLLLMIIMEDTKTAYKPRWSRGAGGWFSEDSAVFRVTYWDLNPSQQERLVQEPRPSTSPLLHWQVQIKVVFLGKLTLTTASTNSEVITFPAALLADPTPATDLYSAPLILCLSTCQKPVRFTSQAWSRQWNVIMVQLLGVSASRLWGGRVHHTPTSLPLWFRMCLCFLLEGGVQMGVGVAGKDGVFSCAPRISHLVWTSIFLTHSPLNFRVIWFGWWGSTCACTCKFVILDNPAIYSSQQTCVSYAGECDRSEASLQCQGSQGHLVVLFMTTRVSHCVFCFGSADSGIMGRCWSLLCQQHSSLTAASSAHSMNAKYNIFCLVPFFWCALWIVLSTLRPFF